MVSNTLQLVKGSNRLETILAAAKKMLLWWIINAIERNPEMNTFGKLSAIMIGNEIEAFWNIYIITTSKLRYICDNI